jgi:hypothetical protein
MKNHRIYILLSNKTSYNQEKWMKFLYLFIFKKKECYFPFFFDFADFFFVDSIGVRSNFCKSRKIKRNEALMWKNIERKWLLPSWWKKPSTQLTCESISSISSSGQSEFLSKYTKSSSTNFDFCSGSSISNALCNSSLSSSIDTQFSWTTVR